MSEEPLTDEAAPPRLSYLALFLRFLRFGLIAFGGPVAQIAMIRRELVEREPWLSSARFNRLLAVMQVLPGPEATELCVHLGIRARGRIGGVLAGLAFVLPGFSLMMGLSWLYFRLDMTTPWLMAALAGAQAAVLALIVRAVFKIGSHVVTNAWLLAIAAAALIGQLAGVSFWIVLPVAGCAYALLRLERRGLATLTLLVGLTLAVAELMLHGPGLAPAFATQVALTPGDAPVWLLFLAGLKAGLLTFGGAYTAIPFLRGDAGRAGWIGDSQFLDGLALSSVVPAPLIIFATFVGYVAGGPCGGVAMTVGIFLPAFAFSLLFYDRLETVLDDARLHALLDGVAAAVVGLIAATAIQLGWGQFAGGDAGWLPVTLFGLALIVTWIWKSPLAAPACLLAAGLASVVLSS